MNILDLPIPMILSLACLSGASSAYAEPAAETALTLTYEVHLQSKRPAEARVSMCLPGDFDETRPEWIQSRAAEVQAKSQIRNVRCDGRTLSEEENGWRLSAPCECVAWQFDLDTDELETVQPSAQQSHAFPGWWLISGPSSLLRLSPEPALDMAVKVTIDDTAANVFPLSARDAPPAYLVVGDAPHQNVGDEEQGLRYIGSDLTTVTAVVDAGRHLDVLRYFKSIMGDGWAREKRLLNVVWFGAPRERHELSGAAGVDTMLANYILPEDNPTTEENLLTFVLIFHEQFHQLDTAAHPVWAAESIAQYYALKAAQRILPPSAGLDAVAARFLRTDEAPGPGLLEIQRQVAVEGKYENYTAFYTKGASFWAALDEAMQSASGGSLSLDDMLPEILSANFESDGAFPDLLLARLNEASGGQGETIVAKFLTGENPR